MLKYVFVICIIWHLQYLLITWKTYACFSVKYWNITFPCPSFQMCSRSIAQIIGMGAWGLQLVPGQSAISLYFTKKRLLWLVAREYFSLGGCVGPERNISLWKGVLVLEVKAREYRGSLASNGTCSSLVMFEAIRTLDPRVIFLFGRVCRSWKEYISEQGNISLPREYFTLGGCAGPEKTELQNG